MDGANAFKSFSMTLPVSPGTIDPHICSQIDRVLTRFDSEVKEALQWYRCKDKVHALPEYIAAPKVALYLDPHGCTLRCASSATFATTTSQDWYNFTAQLFVYDCTTYVTSSYRGGGAAQLFVYDCTAYVTSSYRGGGAAQLFSFQGEGGSAVAGVYNDCSEG